MSSDTTAAPATLSPADEEKKLGNEAFIAKKYDKALQHYTNAITKDPENAIYYSNRSACYAAKQMWKESMIDSEVAIIKDPSFIKAYYRLSMAQLELGSYDDAIQTLQNGLAKEPESELLKKQLRVVATKQAAARNAALHGGGKRQLSESQKKEIMELQEQTSVYNKDLKGVQYKIGALQREIRIGQVTKQQIEALPDDCPLYRACGKAFLSAPDSKFIHDKLQAEQETHSKQIKDLMDRQEYLERRIKSNMLNFKEMTQGL